MFKKRDYENWSFPTLWNFARKEKNEVEKEKIYSFLIDKLNREYIQDFVYGIWNNLSEENKIKARTKILELADGGRTYILKMLYDWTKETFWLEQNPPSSDFNFCCFVAKEVKGTEAGLSAYNRCLYLLKTRKHGLIMHELLDLYELRVEGRDLLWEKIVFLLDMDFENFDSVIPDVVRVTKKLKAVKMWIETLEDVPAWINFLEKCPTEWKRFAYREAGEFLIKLSKRKKLDL